MRETHFAVSSDQLPEAIGLSTGVLVAFEIGVGVRELFNYRSHKLIYHRHLFNSTCTSILHRLIHCCIHFIGVIWLSRGRFLELIAECCCRNIQLYCLSLLIIKWNVRNNTTLTNRAQSLETNHITTQEPES
jgi:hypothetical protein